MNRVSQQVGQHDAVIMRIQLVLMLEQYERLLLLMDIENLLFPIGGMSSIVVNGTKLTSSKGETTL